MGPGRAPGRPRACPPRAGVPPAVPPSLLPSPKHHQHQMAKRVSPRAEMRRGRRDGLGGLPVSTRPSGAAGAGVAGGGPGPGPGPGPRRPPSPSPAGEPGSGGSRPGHAHCRLPRGEAGTRRRRWWPAPQPSPQEAKLCHGALTGGLDGVP
ncbi:translation initiation factor IF-2-like [Moschus berezovskii]|uniref:translation initiation factor IF-2-like n=1 Tax=Moschus berezovskii TaxID=68408 RepID=UPI00244523A6|nr:translation initiation factor IF-2-like [Moschus berezovskii]